LYLFRVKLQIRRIDCSFFQLYGQFLSKLPEKQQEVIRLKFQQQMSYREIAQCTELSESNVGYLLSTGLKTLREQMINL